MSERARGRMPIGVQLVLLLVACLAAMHLLIFVVVALTPPPRPPIYRMSEIAAALTGGPLIARDGRPMVRTVAATLPEDATRPSPPEPGRDRLRHRAMLTETLAATLSRSPQDVRLIMRRPSALGHFLESSLGGRVIIEHRQSDGPPRPPPGVRGEIGRHIMLDGPPGPGGPGGPGPMFRMMARDGAVFGDFTAALRQADGRWTIVRSGPEPFPSDWQKRFALLILAAFAVVTPAGFLFARRITAPLKRFAEAAERLGRDPHAEPVALSGPAEIGQAAEAFNNMQARLRRYIDDRTAMVGAISHDLRTPLARIRFRMEAAPADLRTAVLGDVAQMEQMIQGVLTFIRNESTPRHREKLDLLSLVECVVDDAAMVGGDVEIVESAPGTVEGDPAALQRLFVNLVDNAVKYGAQARIRVGRDADYAVVEIADAGPGLSPEDLERVFQPFYRADPSRNVDAGGIGLGLPIARSTARAHGGDVELSSTAKGVRARVTLPAA